MPRLAIDPVARTIRLRDRVWRFEWDPAAATAAIDLDDRRYELQSLTWRQKRNLARAVRKLGGHDELGGLLLAACLPPHSKAPDTADERDALAHLAGWLTSDGADLPFDPTTLARVTLDICRATQLTPQALDEMTAADVEAMGAAARPEAAAPASQPVPPLDGCKTIVVVPDPVPPPASPEAGAPAVESADSSRRDSTATAAVPFAAAAHRTSDRNGDERTPAVSTRFVPSTAVSVATRRVSAAQATIGSRMRIRVRSIGPPTASAPRPPALRTGPQAALEADGRFEARQDAIQPLAAAEVDAADRARVSESQAQVPNAGRARIAEHDSPERVSGDRVAMSARQGSALPAIGMSSSPNQDWVYDPFIDDGRDGPFGEVREQAPDASDRLRDDLERAAVQAGIDLEG